MPTVSVHTSFCKNMTATKTCSRKVSITKQCQFAANKKGTYQKGVQSWRAEAELRWTRTWPHGYGQTVVCHSYALFP